MLPLRRRLSEPDGLDGAEESVVTEHVGSAYREWKGERIEGLAGDHVVAAVSLGTLSALGTGGGGVEWVAVAAAGGRRVPTARTTGSTEPRRRARSSRRGTPTRRRTRAVDACSRRHPLGCCRAHSE